MRGLLSCPSLGLLLRPPTLLGASLSGLLFPALLRRGLRAPGFLLQALALFVDSAEHLILHPLLSGLLLPSLLGREVIDLPLVIGFRPPLLFGPSLGLLLHSSALVCHPSSHLVFDSPLRRLLLGQLSGLVLGRPSLSRLALSPPPSLLIGFPNLLGLPPGLLARGASLRRFLLEALPGRLELLPGPLLSPMRFPLCLHRLLSAAADLGLDLLPRHLLDAHA
mmetsp:Transcript_77801/g.252127  ORF Transcript_77801/g.252127 Transcript_77801/m.252127 type:complete len:222 (-) Transcript_77801:1512-2177(-)